MTPAAAAATSPARRFLVAGLIAVTVAGLAIDAYVHFDLASQYDANATTTLSEGDLFRAEAIAAIIAAVALLLRPRRYTALLAAAVAGAGTAALVVYRYVDILAFGPIPGMYEPIWFTEKAIALVAEVLATVAAMAAVAGPLRSSRPSG